MQGHTVSGEGLRRRYDLKWPTTRPYVLAASSWRAGGSPSGNCRVTFHGIEDWVLVDIANRAPRPRIPRIPEPPQNRYCDEIRGADLVAVSTISGRLTLTIGGAGLSALRRNRRVVTRLAGPPLGQVLDIASRCQLPLRDVDDVADIDRLLRRRPRRRGLVSGPRVRHPDPRNQLVVGGGAQLTRPGRHDIAYIERVLGRRRRRHHGVRRVRGRVVEAGPDLDCARRG
jgi:hypothetical protein